MGYTTDLKNFVEHRDWVSYAEALNTVNGKGGTLNSTIWNLKASHGIFMKAQRRNGAKGFEIIIGERTRAKDKWSKTRNNQLAAVQSSVRSVSQENTLPQLGSQLKVYTNGLDDNGKYFSILRDDTGKAWTMVITDFAEGKQ